MASGMSESVKPETPETVMLDKLVPDKLSILLVKLMAEKAAEVWREVLEDKLLIWLVKFVFKLLSSDLISEIFESKSFWENPDESAWRTGRAGRSFLIFLSYFLRLFALKRAAIATAPLFLFSPTRFEAD